MLLIYDDEQLLAGMAEEERASLMRDYSDYSEDLVQAGAFVAGAPLQPTTSATTVRVRESETLTTDGPFAETKEQLGGYYLIDVEALDEALEWAARVPSARIGSIEVRPVVPAAARAEAAT